MISGVAVLIPAVYGAGLATGLLHFGVPGCLAALLAAGLVQGRPAGVLAAGTFALACVTGAVAAARDASSCRARLPVGRVELTVRLMDAPTAALVRVQPIGAGCWGAVDARWPHGTKDAAGSIADVRGRWIPRPARGGRVEGVLAVAEIRGRRSASPTAAELVRGTTVARARAPRGKGAARRRAGARYARRNRWPNPGRLRPVRPRPSALHFGISRRAHLCLGRTAPAPRRRPTNPRAHSGRRGRNGLCGLPRVSRAGHARGRPHHPPGAAVQAAAAGAAQRTAGMHVPDRTAGGPLGHLRSRRVALRHGAVGSDDSHSMERRRVR